MAAVSAIAVSPSCSLSSLGRGGEAQFGPTWRNSKLQRRQACTVVRKFPLRLRAEGAEDPKSGKGDKASQDWDRSWQAFLKAGGGKKKRGGPFSFMSNMEQYVTRSPAKTNFPMAEEIDPFKRTEKRALDVWTSPKFTYAGMGVLVVLFVYVGIIVGPPPHH